jgi:carbamoyltransferase
MIITNKKGKTIILSLAFNHHDSNIALSFNTRIVASLELERLFRSKKICASITHMEIGSRYLLENYNLTISDVDFLVVNALNNPFDNNYYFEDIRENEYIFLNKKIKTYIVRHHLAHAGFYYFSKFRKALIASCDGGGDLGERVAYFIGEKLKIKRNNVDTINHTSTKPYGQFSKFLYDEPFSEGKLMALAGLNSRTSIKLQRKVSKIYPSLKNVNFVEGQNLLNEHFKKYKGLALKDPASCSILASCIQKEFIKRRTIDIKSVFNFEHESLILVGGSALNLECNSTVYRSITNRLYIPPNCDDTGTAVGQCAIIIAKLFNKRPICNLPFIGLEEIPNDSYLTKKIKLCNFTIENDPCTIAVRLANNELCIRHFGRPEVGPRALGHRSFLMSPLLMKNRNIISINVKEREWYRPVAPIIIEEDLADFFTGGPSRSPYMLFNYKVKRLVKDRIRAVIHYDGTSRVQTINEKDDPFLYQILIEFKKITGLGMLINTSLNLKGQPLTNFLHDTFEMARKIQFNLFICLK